MNATRGIFWDLRVGPGAIHVRKPRFTESQIVGVREELKAGLKAKRI